MTALAPHVPDLTPGKSLPFSVLVPPLSPLKSMVSQCQTLAGYCCLFAVNKELHPTSVCHRTSSEVDLPFPPLTAFSL